MKVVCTSLTTDYYIGNFSENSEYKGKTLAVGIYCGDVTYIIGEGKILPTSTKEYKKSVYLTYKNGISVNVLDNEEMRENLRKLFTQNSLGNYFDIFSVNGKAKEIHYMSADKAYEFIKKYENAKENQEIKK